VPEMPTDLQPVLQDGKLRLLSNGLELGHLYYSMRRGQAVLKPDRLSLGPNNTVEAFLPGAELVDEFAALPGLIKVKRRWRILKPGRWQLTFGYCPSPDLKQWVVPSVMYRENRMGSGHFPSGGVDEGWSFREDRIPIPSCSILHDGSSWQAIFASPAATDDEISSVKTYLSDSKPAFEIRVPYTEEPFTYTEKGLVIGGLTGKSERSFHINIVPFEYTRTFYLASGTCQHPSEIYMALTAAALAEFSPGDRTPAIDWSRMAGLKLKHLDYLLIDRPEITAIKQGKGNGIFQPFYEYTSGSFLCKSLEAALIYARAGEELGRSEYLDIAQRIGRFFLQGALLNGLHRDCYSLKDDRWGGYFGVGMPRALQRGANARCNGEAMVNYLRLFRQLDKCGKTNNSFLVLATDNARFYMENQLADGGFGRWWDISGEPLSTLGTNGAYIISLLVELEKTTAAGNEINKALDKARQYYASLIDSSGFYADTLDADCTDKEAGAALLRAFLDLYEKSRNDNDLKYARLAAGFILSWMFTYNVAFNPQSPVGRRHFNTRGMTAVSVAHHHLDFYGLFIAYDFLRLWQYTGESLWKSCALLMINACSQLMADEKDRLGRSKDFTGWQPEQVNQTNWDYKSRLLGTKGKFHTCVAWVVVLTLGAMLDIRERFPDILDFSLKKPSKA